MDMTEIRRLQQVVEVKIGFIKDLQAQVERLATANSKLAIANEHLRDANKTLHRELATLLEEATEWQTQKKECLEVLADIERVYNEEYGYVFCPSCDGVSDKHTEDCRLDAVLKAHNSMGGSSK